MWCARLLLFFLIIGGLWRHVRCTCVLESEFGFTLNCAFKKSGLFRVRNLGGVKAHVGIGFSLGDELGFPESLSNVEYNRRRSTNTNGLQNIILQESVKNQQNNQVQNVKYNVRPQVATPKPSIQNIGQNQMALAIAVPVTPKQTANIVPQKNADNKPQPFKIPPFKPIPPAQERPTNEKVAVPSMAGIVLPTYGKDSLNKTQMQDKTQLNSNNLSTRVLPASQNQQNSIPHVSIDTIKALSTATNISVEAIEMAIEQKQKQLMRQQQQQAAMHAKTTTTRKPPTTQPPTKKHVHGGKVMNAPKEYYPVGYDKNFDDNFASRVDLPPTSFYCGDQKHFPGLYADEDLGCMVFHVCALTDDGLIMKSFLCPESTLFDQTILKCNWWFYVDCKNSKKLYDSNIPISKSYQLMKALTFFSSYRKESSTTQSSIDEKI